MTLRFPGDLLEFDSMYTLYTHPFSQHGRRVVALMDMADIPYEQRIVALYQAEHLSPQFLKLNPNHQVPVLRAGEMVMSESGAILRWLCFRHGLDNFYPTDFVQRAATDQWLDWTTALFGPAVSLVVFNAVFAGEMKDETALAGGRKSLKELLPILAERLEDNDWLSGGSHPSIADLAAGTNIAHLALADAEPEQSTISGWHARLCGFDGFRECLPPQMAHA